MRFVHCLVALLAVLPVFASASAPDPRRDRNPEDYPLRVHIFTDHSRRHHHFHYTTGHGRGNLIEGDEIHGMEYDYDCGERFMESDPDEDYFAKWKKPGLKLQLLIGVIGSDTATRTCNLEVALKDFVYVRKGGHIESISVEEYRARQETRIAHDEALNPLDTDPGHYPLQISVLALQLGAKESGMYMGSGQGNLLTSDGPRAMDFSDSCPMPLRTTPEGRFLKARWLGPDSMQVLLSGIGEGAPSATCELRTQVHPDVYVRAGGNVKAIPAEEYNRRQAPPPAQ